MKYIIKCNSGDKMFVIDDKEFDELVVHIENHISDKLRIALDESRKTAHTRQKEIDYLNAQISKKNDYIDGYKFNEESWNRKLDRLRDTVKMERIDYEAEKTAVRRFLNDKISKQKKIIDDHRYIVTNYKEHADYLRDKIEGLEAELFVRKGDSKTLMKVVDIVNNSDELHGYQAINQLADTLVNYLDVPYLDIDKRKAEIDDLKAKLKGFEANERVGLFLDPRKGSLVHTYEGMKNACDRCKRKHPHSFLCAGCTTLDQAYHHARNEMLDISRLYRQKPIERNGD